MIMPCRYSRIPQVLSNFLALISAEAIDNACLVVMSLLDILYDGPHACLRLRYDSVMKVWSIERLRKKDVVFSEG